jgi:predicted metal-dependent peptidase
MTKHLTHAVRIQKARTALLLDHPFFGSLLFRLGGLASNSIQTMATDGVSLFYNPAFVDTLNAAELAGVLAHEVMHPALQHHTRRGDRDRKRWNMACDYVINPLLLDAGLALPKDVLIEHRFLGMSAERIYNLIEEQQGRDGSDSEEENRDYSSSDKEGGKQPGNPSADSGPTAPTTPGGFGQVLDAPEPEGDDGDTVSEQARTIRSCWCGLARVTAPRLVRDNSV